MSQEIGRMISTHKNAANSIRIGHDRSILCFRGIPSAGNAIVIQEAPNAVRYYDTKHAPHNFQISTELHPEDLRIARLDFLAHALDAGGIVLPQLDLVEPARPWLLLGERVDRMLTSKIDQELLRLERVQPVLEQPRGFRIGRRLEYCARAGHERRAFGRINDLDRLPRLLELDQIVIVAVGHYRALAERELLRRVGR